MAVLLVTAVHAVVAVAEVVSPEERRGNSNRPPPPPFLRWLRSAAAEDTAVDADAGTDAALTGVVLAAVDSGELLLLAAMVRRVEYNIMTGKVLYVHINGFLCCFISVIADDAFRITP